MANSRPLVSVISVNYNEPEETREFLKSLYKSDYPNFETIIVDNGSKRKVEKKLEKLYPNLTCIISKKNLGFAGGNNLGIDLAKGEYFVFLNNDTLVPSDFIKIMVRFIQQNPNVGIASPRLVFQNGKIQYAGSTNLNSFTGRGKRIGFNEEDKGQYNRNYRTDLTHGAAMIVPKKVVDRVGKMHEQYFLYYEELDWCTRIKNNGFEAYYIGETYVIHKESVSVGIESPLKTYYMSRNRILYLRRNSYGLYKVSSIVFYCIFGTLKSSVVFLYFRKINLLKNLWRGVLWHLDKKYFFKG